MTAVHRFGLKVIYEPPVAATSGDQLSSPADIHPVNIIFVHGLGGSPSDTWTHPESRAFWPSLLHEMDGVKAARILTFGYNANFTNVFRPNSVLGIADFAGQLLDALDLFYHKYGEVVLPSIELI